MSATWTAWRNDSTLLDYCFSVVALFDGTICLEPNLLLAFADTEFEIRVGLLGRSHAGGQVADISSRRCVPAFAGIAAFYCSFLAEKS